MLRIKLAPFGKKHERHYRIVVAEDRSKISGKTDVVLGHYHPLTKELTFDQELYKQWLKKGAQPTDRIRKICKTS